MHLFIIIKLINQLSHMHNIILNFTYHIFESYSLKKLACMTCLYMCMYMIKWLTSSEAIIKAVYS